MTESFESGDVSYSPDDEYLFAGDIMTIKECLDGLLNEAEPNEWLPDGDPARYLIDNGLHAPLVVKSQRLFYQVEVPPVTNGIAPFLRDAFEGGAGDRYGFVRDACLADESSVIITVGRMIAELDALKHRLIDVGKLEVYCDGWLDALEVSPHPLPKKANMVADIVLDYRLKIKIEALTENRRRMIRFKRFNDALEAQGDYRTALALASCRNLAQMRQATQTSAQANTPLLRGLYAYFDTPRRYLAAATGKISRLQTLLDQGRLR